MEIAGFVVAVVAVLVAVGSVIYAARADRTAKDALNLQVAVDARQREFRSVVWEAESTADDEDPPNAFTLTNAGDTDAREVSVVLQLGWRERETHHLGDIPARETRTITSDAFAAWIVGARDHEYVHPAYRVHWSSPLGQVDDQDVPARDIIDFMPPSERP